LAVIVRLTAPIYEKNPDWNDIGLDTYY